ncbi:MAG: PEGA domain-containing protein [Vicinamibacterales bacterium]
MSPARTFVVAAAVLSAVAMWPSTAAAQRQRQAVPRASAPQAPRPQAAAPRAAGRPASSAQATRPVVTRQAVPRTTVRPGRVYVVRSYFYRPFYFSRPLFWGPYGWGFGASWYYGAYGYPGQWGYPYPYRPLYGPRYRASSVKIQVLPKTAEVFVDGYYAGVVDDFDGTFQSLDLEPGQHEIVVWAPGHRTIRQRVYLQPGRTLRIAEKMQALEPGDPGEPRPEPPPETGGRRAPFYGQDREEQPIPRGRRPMPPDQAPPRPERPDAPAVSPENLGQLVMRIQPAGSTVLVDGEEWRGPEDQRRLIVRLTPGEHQVEVRKEGYQTFTTSVWITAREPVTLNVSLLEK